MSCKCFSRVCSFVIVGFSVAALVGCGGGDKVSGTVTYEDGTKLTHGTVTFAGKDAEERAQIQEDGTYKLDEGLPAGDYEVLVTATEKAPEPSDEGGEGEEPDYGGDGKSLVDSNYGTLGKSPIKYTAPGENPFDIKVKKAAE